MNEIHPSLIAHPRLLEVYEFGLDHPANRAVTNNNQLMDVWRDVYSSDDMRPVPNVLGVMRQIHGVDHPHALLSVDIDDVLRDSNAAFLALGNYNTEEHAGEDYVGCFGNAFGVPNNYDIVGPAIRGLLLKGGVPPVNRLHRIRDHLQYLREHGTFIMASTSTVPGTETATIEFLSLLPECFDGIAFLGNHDGKGQTTKGSVKKVIRNELGTLAGETKIFETYMVDDAPHHIFNGREAAAEMRVYHADATPSYPWNRHIPDLNITPHPVDAFEYIQEKFDSQRSKV